MLTLVFVLLAQTTTDGYADELLVAAFGFGGVIAGSFIARDSERRRWLREARERAYVEFILRVAELNSAAATYAETFAQHDQNRDDRRLDKRHTDAARGYWNAYSNLEAEYRRVELVGSPVFRQVAHDVHVRASVFLPLDALLDSPLEPLDGSWLEMKRQHWLDYDVDEIEIKQGDLTGQARRDLGNEPIIPRLTGPPLAWARRHLTPEGRRIARLNAELMRLLDEMRRQQQDPPDAEGDADGEPHTGGGLRSQSRSGREGYREGAPQDLDRPPDALWADSRDCATPPQTHDHHGPF